MFARLVGGARLSLGVAFAACLCALAIGAAVGGLAGFAGGIVDDGLMRVSEVVMGLPVIYAALTLRAALPLVLTDAQVFWTMTGVFGLIGWPLAARGVRAIVAVERGKEYAEAARSAGSGGYAVIAPSPDAGDLGVSRGPGHTAPAGVHHRRSDAVVRRTWISWPCAKLGSDAAGRWRRPSPGRCSVVAVAGVGHSADGPRHQPHRAQC